MVTSTSEEGSDITVMDGDVYFWTEGGGWVLFEDIQNDLEEDYPWGIDAPLEQLLKATHAVCVEYVTLKDEYDQLLERYTDLQR